MKNYNATNGFPLILLCAALSGSAVCPRSLLFTSERQRPSGCEWERRGSEGQREKSYSKCGKDLCLIKGGLKVN